MDVSRPDAGRVGWLVQANLLIPHGELWSADGDPSALAQFSTGVSLRLGGSG